MRLIRIKLVVLGSLVILGSLITSSFAKTPEMETRYRALEARFEVRDKSLSGDLKAYLQAYPYTTFADEVNFMQGVLQVEKGHYKQGVKILEQVEARALSRPHQTDYAFYRGYAYLMQQEYGRAAIYFGQLSKSTHRYTTRATYYYAYCLYKDSKYAQALPVLEQLETVKEYQQTVPYYIVQIRYMQGETEDVEARAITLLQQYPNNENNAELHRILGEIYFARPDYILAAEQLDAYVQATTEQQTEPVREDLYMLGVAEYKNAHFEQAVQALKKVKQEKDHLSEAACLTLGNAYVHLNQPEQAKLAYQAAASYGLTPSVTEEASYNYTLCTYRSSSALGESVRAFNEFLTKFPNSKYEASVYQLLSDALMQSKNYAAAIATLDSIPNPTPKMRETKQYLRYQLGADCYLQGKMQQAVDWMSEVINHTSESDRYTTEAYYMRAEANYRLRAYGASEQDTKAFFARPDARHSANYTVARYLQGYSYFSQTQYDPARSAFSTYIDAIESTDPSYADALNRIGDCYFNARNFTQAISYYAQVSALQAAGADYALFQRAYALGLQHKYRDKITVLRELVATYPHSDYADDGIYEIARAQLQLNEEQAAVGTYEQLLTAYPNSTLARKASLERAMLYRNLHQTNQAIAAYRKTIETYPATEEAYTALEALQALYVETGNVSEYMAYTKQLAKMNMNITTQEDSLLYAAAEMQYMQASYQKAAVAFAQYIAQYCAGGRYCPNARYYLADSYYRMGNKSDALTHYAVLAEMASNPYQKEAATKVAEISYDNQDYATASDAYYRMLSLASTREQVNTARLGILDCNQHLNRYQTVIDMAGQILSDKPISDEMRTVALYGRAKAYIAQGLWIEAMPDLEQLSQEVRTAQGAEAKYLLAQAYFEQQLLDEAEAQVMAFTKMNTQQQYWLARALILLSDINLRRGENFQARQYLLVLQQNYLQQGDDIPALIEARLTALDQLENPVAKEEVEDEE